VEGPQTPPTNVEYIHEAIKIAAPLSILKHEPVKKYCFKDVSSIAKSQRD